ncbi:2-amino-4-hydroxy-6-hydroxymethyldihydropteridine diphosphokinase [Aphanothece hegewaldii CCALA 016]|uniref:2-amino-4-hydroxy-6-hydroxymethyldihydropteridine diphosphokinase n=1 Tax=Aphanothece hegewaldii CCALA 016 TaxID=2107694 RepID=A0A2T1LX70_9CHRO|nr:2-amino-4-hydroxy-6-hydroxymethyldihydropteridine diphosphokinase [Aphanothece hegewaldii]PSF36768.1 2-amino-4-hydroxy-6-hydroxymethyldihydropteridine diphosphokinase [Aphanothece hegewaldii CCALA 016]
MNIYLSTEVKQAAIALGSNLGDSYNTLESALTALNHTLGINVLSRSHWYKTSPIGPTQPDYLNGCAILEIQLSPQLLLETLLEIEQKFGRIRLERWGPRTLDLDLLLYDNLIIETPALQIPHPRLTERAFVLVPLAEIAPTWIEPIRGKAIAELLKDVDCSGVNLYSPA